MAQTMPPGLALAFLAFHVIAGMAAAPADEQVRGAGRLGCPFAGAAAGASASSMQEGVGGDVWPAEDAESVHLQRDMFTGRHVLTHSLTYERLELPAGDWSLHDLDGFASLVNFDMVAEEEQAAWATDFFSSSVFFKVGADGPVMLLAAGVQGDAKPISFRLWSDSVSGFHWKNITWQCGELKATISRFAGHYIIPRAGAYWWWRLQGLHSNLGVAACQNLRAPHSRWVSKRIASWGTWLGTTLNMSGSLTRGIGKGASDNFANPADWASCSTHGLLALLARLAFLDKAKGGLGNSDERLAASTYLDIAECCSWQPLVLEGLRHGATPRVEPTHAAGRRRIPLCPTCQ